MTMSSPLLGGVFLEYLSWQYIFIFLSSLGLFLTVICLCFFKETNNERTTFERGIASVCFTFLGKNIFLKYTILLTATYSMILLMTSYISVYLLKSYDIHGLTNSYFYAFMVFSYMVGNLVAGRLINDRVIFKLVLSGMIMLTVSVFIPLMLSEISIYVFIIIIFTTNVGIGIVFPVCSGEIIKAFPEHRGTVSACYGFLQMLFSAIIITSVSFVSTEIVSDFFYYLFFISITGVSLFIFAESRLGK